MELALEKGTVINQKYMVEKKLETKVKNQINYLCIEIKTKKQVLVKEFCPAYALRDENGHMKLGESDLNEYASFLNKNRMAEKFQTIPTLMSVLEVFEANNTCYAVCEYVQGETVERLIKKGGEFTKNAVKNMLLNLLKTNEILAGFGYMINDFFPNNVIITDLGDVKICEFNIEEKRAAEPKSLKSLVVLAYYMLTGVAIKSKTSARKLQKPFMDKMERYLLNVAAAESHEVSISDFTAAVNSNFENVGNHEFDIFKWIKRHWLPFAIVASVLTLIVAAAIGMAVKNGNLNTDPGVITTIEPVEIMAEASYCLKDENGEIIDEKPLEGWKNTSKNSNSGGDNGGIGASDEPNVEEKLKEWVRSIGRNEYPETLGGDDIGSSAEKITVKFKLAEGKYSVTSAIQYAGADKPEKEEKQPDGDGYYTIDADISDNGMDTITVTVETKGKGLLGREITAKKTVYKLSYTKQQLAQLEKIVVESENAVLAPEFSRNTTGYDVVLGENQGTVKITWVKPENVNVTVTDINGKPLEKGVGNTVDVTEADFTVKAEQGTEGDVYKLVLTGNEQSGIAENTYTITVKRNKPAQTPKPKATPKPATPKPVTSTLQTPTPTQTPDEVQTPPQTQTPDEVQTPPQTQTPDTPEPGKPTPAPTPQLTPGTE